MKTNHHNFDKNYNFNKDIFTNNLDLSINILINLSKWHYYQTVVKNYTLSKYSNLFGEIDSNINDIRNLNLEIDLLIHSFILNVGGNNKNFTKKSKLYNQFINQNNFNDNPNNINILLNNILLKFENLKNQHLNKELNSFEFKADNYKNELLHLYKNLVKNIHPDINKFDFSKLKMSNGISVNISTNDLFVIIQYLESEGDIKRLMALDFAINQIKNKKSINSINTSNKLQFLDNWINSENEEFIRQEPYCYYNNLNDQKWIENKSKTLQHKLTLEEKRFESQRNLLNRISNITL